MRRRRAALVESALASVILVLAACSSDSGGSSATDAPGTTVPDATVQVTTPSTTAAPSTTTAPSTTVATAGAPTIAELLALGRPIVLGHAGGEDEFPHSTPYAFAQSARVGVDMLDMDVQLTGDGVLIVQHDDSVDRTTEATGRVADMTYDQIAQLDNAYWFTMNCVCKDQPEAAYVYRGIRTGAKPPPDGATPEDFIVPRFRDIAERFPDVPLNIEVKGNGAPAIAAADQLVKELTELGRLDSVVVTSFDDTVNDHLRQIAPTLEITPGLDLSTKWVLDRTPLPEGMRILQLPIEYSGLKVITPELIADSHAKGYVIWVWPNDHSWENEEGYGTLLGWGLDGLNINYPGTGVKAMRAFVEAENGS